MNDLPEGVKALCRTYLDMLNEDIGACSSLCMAAFVALNNFVEIVDNFETEKDQERAKKILNQTLPKSDVQAVLSVISKVMDVSKDDDEVRRKLNSIITQITSPQEQRT